MLIQLLTKLLIKLAEFRGSIFKITGTSGPEDVYLIRYYIIKSRYFNFFVHQFLRSDRDDLHDHPWDFCTYLVSGSYTERKYNPDTGEIESMRRVNSASGKLNRLVFRKATDQHQVVVHRDLKEFEKDQAATTLFFSGPIKREWGFVKEHHHNETAVERKWIPWREYLGFPPNAPRR